MIIKLSLHNGFLSCRSRSSAVSFSTASNISIIELNPLIRSGQRPGGITVELMDTSTGDQVMCSDNHFISFSLIFRQHEQQPPAAFLRSHWAICLNFVDTLMPIFVCIIKIPARSFRGKSLLSLKFMILGVERTPPTLHPRLSNTCQQRRSCFSVQHSMIDGTATTNYQPLPPPGCSHFFLSHRILN